MRRASFLVAAALILAAGVSARAEAVTVIRGGRVVPVVGEPIEGGVVVIRGEKIVHVGAAGSFATPDAATIVDARGKVVMPGLVDAFTHVGTREIGAVAVTRDDDEATSPMTPAVQTADALNVSSAHFRVTRLNGTTSVLIAPAPGNLISGRSCVIALDGERLESMLRLPDAALHASLGDPPKLRYGAKNQMPGTRMGEMAMLRQAIVKAREYVETWARYVEKRDRPREAGEDAPTPPARDLDREAWRPILTRERPLIVRAHRLSDLQSALRLAREFELRIALFGAAESWKMADEIAAAGVPVLLGTVTTQPSSHETLAARMDTARLLEAAGVELVLVSASAHNARQLPYLAGIAMSYGLPAEAAIASITIRPARVLGIDDQVGSLEPGKDADVIVLDGDVVQPRTRVTHMWIRGKPIELTSRQTELAEKYR
jgi:imidazolonepropionase-like amidohydrolase